MDLDEFAAEVVAVEMAMVPRYGRGYVWHGGRSPAIVIS
jgi:hypothetical protein